MPKIPSLPAMTSVDTADELPIEDVSASTTKYITLTKLKEWFQSLVGWITTAMLGDSQVTGVKLGTPIAFEAYNCSGTSFTNGVDSIKATFASEIYDYGSAFASNKFTAPYDGVYHFDASVGDWTSSATRSFLSFYKNGASIAIGQDGGTRKCDGSCTLKLTAGDYIEVYCFQSSGANRTGSASEGSSYFMGFLVGRV